MRRFVDFAVVLSSLLGLAGLASPAQADVIGFAVDFNTLYSVDLTTATAIPIGSTGVPVSVLGGLEGLAISPSGALFGTDVRGFLYSISTTTGLATPIGDTRLGNIEGLDFNGSTLLGTNFNNPTTFYAINTNNAAVTPLVTTNPAQGVMRAMAVQDPTTALSISDSPTFWSLISTDLTSGATTVLGTITPFFGGMDFGPDGVLYGLTSNPAGNEYLINPSNGALSLVGNTGNQIWLGLAISPIPEPPAIVGAGLGGLTLIGVTWLRRWSTWV